MQSLSANEKAVRERDSPSDSEDMPRARSVNHHTHCGFDSGPASRSSAAAHTAIVHAERWPARPSILSGYHWPALLPRAQECKDCRELHTPSVRPVLRTRPKSSNLKQKKKKTVNKKEKCRRREMHTNTAPEQSVCARFPSTFTPKVMPLA